MTAFVLGAGLGTRLRPLTDTLPKPLVPVIRKPLITFAFDHLIADAGVERFVINTHHRAEAYAATFPDNTYRGRPLHFRHEPVLLETAGGIKNVADLLPRDEPFWVYNGDILTDLPLAPALAQHRASGALVTLILRTGKDPSDPRHIAFDPATGHVRDIRNLLNTGLPTDYLFSGIYLVNPAFLDRIPPATKLSVIPLFLEMLRANEPLGGIVADTGDWRDLGTRAEYLRIHRDLLVPQKAGGEIPTDFPRYEAPDPRWREPIDPTANVHPTAHLHGASVVGARATVGAEALLDDSIVWSDAVIIQSCRLRRCIVRTGQQVCGERYEDRDL